jgi:hypothetical protein
MTVKEMHIGIDMILQKVNSNVISSFEPEEKDWVLNEEVNRFIKQRLSILSNEKRLGFQDTQKRVDDLKNLITSKTLSCYQGEDNSFFSFLPNDYMLLVNDRSLIEDLCGNLIKTTDYQNETIYTYQFNPFFELDDSMTDIEISINSISVFKLIDYYPSGFTDVNMIYELNNFIVDSISKAGYNIILKDNKFYITSTSPLIIAFIGFDSYPPTLVTSSKVLKKVVKKSNYSYIQNNNRLVKTEDLYELLGSAFGKTSPASPISSLKENLIIVYHNQKFICSEIKIDYIRKPKKINLSLNQDCELHDSIHQEIVENTAKRIAGLTFSQVYNNIINENLNKE